MLRYYARKPLKYAIIMPVALALIIPGMLHWLIWDKDSTWFSDRFEPLEDWASR